MVETPEGAVTASKLDLWTPYRDLYQKIDQVLYQGITEDAKIETFTNLLTKHKQTFLCLLQNPPKNPKSRDELKKGMEDGISVKEIGHQVLSRDLYQEAVILSDMYNLNEFVALDLLCTAQVQMSYHPGLPRGLVAVLLYYEGRKFIVQSLKLLVHARKGVLWSMNVDTELEKYVMSFTQQLLEGGIFNRIFELLQTLDLSAETKLLHENVALGGPKHQRQVFDLYSGIRQCLAETVYLWAAQSGLPKEPTLSLLGFLRQLKPEEDSAGIVDNVTLFVLLAALYAFDISILNVREDGEERIQDLPILSDKDLVRCINAELLKTWVDQGLEGVVSLAFAVTIAALRRLPLEVQLTNQKQFVGLKVFSFLCAKVLPNGVIFSDEIVTRRFHYLFTDFIVYLFAEAQRLDESNFEQFMMCLTKFYAKDPLKLHYCLEFWSPLETNELYSITPARTLSLHKFIKVTGDAVPGVSFVVFVNMLASLSNHPQAARYCFNLLKQGNQGFNKMLSWDHFFTCFSQYYNNLKQEVIHVYRSFQTKGITPQEIEGLLAVLNLIRVVAQDDFSRLALCEHPVWAPLTVLLGLVGCSVPIHFKASLIFTLAALSKSSEIASQMWNYIEASQILQTIPTTSRYQPRGIQTELEEVESRLEEYPLTQSFLKLLDILTDSGIPRTLGAGPRQPGFDPYLTYLVNSVFLKFTTRPYKTQEERWIVGCACLKLFDKFLTNYEPQAVDFTSEFNPPPGFHLMLLLNSKSEFLNLLLFIIDEGQKLFAQYLILPGQNTIAKCILHCLNILERSLVLQQTFAGLSSCSPNPPLLTNLVKLLLLNNPRTGQPDHLISIAKYVTFYNTLPKHTQKVLEILINVTNTPVIHTNFLNILLTFDKESKAIRDGLVECLDNGETPAKLSILKLLKQCLNYSTPNVSQFLLGFDLTQDISKMVFQPAGILDFPRTCLHSIFTILKCSTYFPKELLDSAYEILYILYSYNKTTEPITRFTRLNTNFFEQHVTRCLKSTELTQLAWLFKTLAVEIKLSCSKTQILYLQGIVRLLTGQCPAHTSSTTLNLHQSNLLENLLDIIAEDLKRSESANFIDALRQLIQVLAMYVPYEVTPPAEQLTTHSHLLKKILKFAIKTPLASDDANHLSATVLVLLQSVRRCSKKTSSEDANTGLLNDVFGDLLRWLLISDAGCQNLRIHLYVSIITFLRIAYCNDISSAQIETTPQTFYISRLDTSKLQVAQHPLAANIPTTLAKCGERLIDLICQDCIGGHDVAKMLAMLTFSLLINTSGDNTWIVFMASRGYLKYLISSILKSDDDLKHLLEPSFENLRSMYLYKAKMSLLLQLAGSKIGAEHLLELKIFPCLSNMTVLNLHPDVVKQSQLLSEPSLQDFIPGVDSRYLEIFIPALQLCNAIITSLTIDNYTAITQILDFIVSQLNAIEFVVRCGSTSLSSTFLHELATVTSTLALVSRGNVAFVTKIQETFQNYHIPMLRLQKHMMVLLTKFLLNENIIQELLSNPPQDGNTFQTSERLSHTIQIISNLLYYLRNNITNSSTLFKPSLGTFSLNLSSVDDSETQVPTIGTIVQHLIDFVTYHLEAKNTLTFLKIKLSDIPNMSHADLMEFVKLPYEGVDTEIVRNEVAEFVSNKLAKKEEELKHAAFIIDNALYLLWVHLDHYMLQAIPRIRHGEIADGMSFRGEASEAMWNVTINDINNIKQGLVPVFNDTFSRQLLETTQGTTEVKRQFVELLLRKIKRLLQFVPVSQAI